MGLLRTVFFHRIFRFSLERSEELVGIRSAPGHLDETGIQFTVCLLRLARTFHSGSVFVYTVLDEKKGTDMENIMDGIR